MKSDNPRLPLSALRPWLSHSTSILLRNPTLAIVVVILSTYLVSGIRYACYRPAVSSNYIWAVYHVHSGHPETEETLNRSEVRHLKQRIALHCRTGLLTLQETRDYIRARLDTAGATGKAIFSPEAVNSVHVYSGGIPRLINVMCEAILETQPYSRQARTRRVGDSS